MNDAKRMHALMIGQPNFGAPPKARRGKGGRFVKATAEPPPPNTGEAAAPPEPPPAPPAAEAEPSAQTDRTLWRSHRQRGAGTGG